jgi:ribosome-associated heat shock protein Hsp15
MSEAPPRLRMDKWLWAARFYKTRGLAVEAVETGRALLNGERVKRSKDVKPGDIVTVRAGALEWTIEVRGISERRGPASEAALLYAESEDSRAKRARVIAERRAGPQPVAHGLGRPTKRDRRTLDRFTRGD